MLLLRSDGQGRAGTYNSEEILMIGSRGDIEVFHTTMVEFSNLTIDDDKVIRKPGNREVFSVKAAYRSLHHSEVSLNL